ncbi:N-acetyltransferase [Antarcticibacterium sp. 1MA-6-2]|uniref:GNAT family N-acetyltransferase n=1 Tax=Antarcticibacterium sp. 1MA-6-2 TaxID=2908210 RepID=UPI001F2191C8|nr:GNAT family N-acetyltransferase [Antarcticibacterium sp. 1MA-6-2]UJH90025.1 N-acetyltransferase [Antarcticibacterium sp. 1MA-6-2]
MKIEHNNSDGRGIFKAKDGGKDAGEMTYSRTNDSKIIIEHTQVEPEFQGQGVGKKLVQEAVGYSRQNNLKIVPECSYAKKVLQRSPEYEDVLA